MPDDGAGKPAGRRYQKHVFVFLDFNLALKIERWDDQTNKKAEGGHDSGNKASHLELSFSRLL